MEFDDETMVHPVPDFVIEILSKSPAHIDPGVKFMDYAAHKIGEYWIVNYKKQVVEQFILKNKNDKEYTLLNTLKIGQNIESQIITNFKIPVEAIFDKAANLKALLEIIAK